MSRMGLDIIQPRVQPQQQQKPERDWIDKLLAGVQILSGASNIGKNVYDINDQMRQNNNELNAGEQAKVKAAGDLSAVDPKGAGYAPNADDIKITDTATARELFLRKNAPVIKPNNLVVGNRIVNANDPNGPKVVYEGDKKLIDTVDPKTGTTIRGEDVPGAVIKVPSATGKATTTKEDNYDASVKIGGAGVKEGYRPSQKDADAVRKAKLARDTITSQLDQLDGLHKQFGTKLVGDASNAAAVIEQKIVMAQKELDNLGVLQGRDEALIKQAMPSMISIEENAKDFFGAGAYDAKSLQYRKSLEDQYDATLDAYGYQRAKAPDEKSGLTTPGVKNRPPTIEEIRAEMKRRGLK